MTRTIMIDLPSVMNGGKIQAHAYLEAIDCVKELKGVEIIHREELILEYGSYEEMSLLLDQMSRVEIKAYGDYDLSRAKFTKTCPELQHETFPQELNDEICLQAHTLHMSRNTLFLVSQTRWANGNSLTTTKDKRTVEHDTLVTENKASVDAYMALQRPRLDQHKHTSKQRSFANQTVSPFSAYDSRNEEPAKALLQRAYDMDTDDEKFPQYLYAWDSEHKTFVEFRRSTEDGAYHGFDCTRDAVKPNVLKLLHK